jgi:hypothetical protein
VPRKFVPAERRRALLSKLVLHQTIANKVK